MIMKAKVLPLFIQMPIKRHRVVIKLLFMAVMAYGSTTSSYGQILNNSTKISEKSGPAAPIVVTQSVPETLNVTPATIEAIKNEVLATPTPQLEGYSEVRKLADSLAKERSRLTEISERLQNDSQALMNAKAKVKAAQDRINTIALSKQKSDAQALDSLRKAKEEEDRKSIKELQSKSESIIAAARSQSALNKLSLSLTKKLRSADSTIVSPDSLNVLSEKLIPDLRSKVAKNTFLANNLHTLFDSTHNTKRRMVLNDSLSDICAIYSGIADDNKDLNSRVRDVIKTKQILSTKIKSLSKEIEDGLKRTQDELNFNSTEQLTAYQSMMDQIVIRYRKIEEVLKDEIGPAIISGTLEYKQLLKQYISLGDKFSKTSNDLTRLQKDNINLTPKVKSEEMDFGALPNLTQLIGDNRAPNLNISIVGSFSSTSETINSTFETKIFTANLPKELQNAKALFIPELSSFGVQVAYSLGWETRSQLGRNSFLNHRGVNVAVNLLNKKVLNESQFAIDEDLSNFTAHLKGGFEQVIVKDRMSVYANVSWIGLIDNVKNFREQYSQFLEKPKQSTFWFGDFGARFLLLPNLKNVSAGGNLQIYADINFTLPGIWGRDIMQTDDKIMTLVKIGFKKSLGIIHRQTPKLVQ
jgi:hypothetical protein